MSNNKMKVFMELQSKEEAQAFVFFMLNERNRHIDDIEQIEETVARVCKAFGISAPESDPNIQYWTIVKDDPPAIQTVPLGPYLPSDEGDY